MNITIIHRTLLNGLIVGILLFAPITVQAAEGSDGKYDHLIAALSTNNESWLIDAANYLGDHKSKEAVEPLIRMLAKEDNYSCRMAAIVALGKIGDSRALPILKECAVNDRDKILRHVAYANYLEIQSKVKLAGQSD